MSPAQRHRRGVESPFFQSKFRIPRDPRHFVPRPRLLALLDDLVEYPVIAIVAPAGAGKTALAADWLRHSDRPCVWLTLDDADRDPSQFWRSVMAVLEPLAAGAPAARSDVAQTFLTPHAARDGMADHDDADLAGTTATLVIDDLDRLDQDERACAALEALVLDRPPTLRLLLLSRHRPPLPVDRLRAAGELADIHFDALRFSTDEAERLLTSLCPDTPATDLAVAVDRAEGWTAALKLTALSIRSGHSVAAPSRSAQVAGPDKLIDEYLWQEVLRGERPELIRMLLATSVVGRLNYGLAEALTGRRDGGDLLEEAEERGLFVTRLDDGGWFQVHSLVRDMLIAKYARRWPMGLSEQHARAARWFESVNDHPAALDHWLQAERPTDALRVLADGALSLVDSGRSEVLGRVIDQLPPGVAGGAPDPLVQYAWCALMYERTRFHDALAEAERVLGGSDGSSDPRIELLHAAESSLSGDFEGCERQARHALGRLQEDACPAPVALFGWTLLAVGTALREQWHDGAGLVGEIRQALNQDADHQVVFASARVLGLAVAGRPVDAIHAASVLEHVGEGAELPKLRTELALADGIVAAEVGERERARSTLIELAGRSTYPVPSFQLVAKLELVQLYVASGQLEEALAEFRRAESLLADLAQPVSSAAPTDIEAPGPWMSGAVARVGTALSLANNDLEAAADWSQRVTDPFWGPVCRAKVSLARHEDEEAAETVLLATPRCVRHEVVHQLVLARALATHDRGRATATVEAAVQRAADHGLLQTVADEGTEVHELIELAAWRVPDAWLGRLRHVLVPTWESHESGPVEPLTERERDVLRLLPSRLTLREVASELYISANTLKFHLRAIYRKLGVDSRQSAVQAARQMRLLPGG
jgi:LuxR family maltose regulon positive regulatory protein